MFNLTYIHHDCFLLTTPEAGVVFDFWRDPLCKHGELPAFIRDFPKDKPLYVLVSHFHKDHFNKEIFNWALVHPDIRYVISRDVARHMKYMLKPDSRYSGVRVDPEKLNILSKPEVYSDDVLSIHCFGSTDIGNSYAVVFKAGDLKVFHAGDLNCWTWRDESSQEEVEAAEKAFISELRPIAEAFPKFDIAMFPVDSRIGTGFNEGAKIFLESIDVERFFPMHFTLAETHEQLEQRKNDALDFKAYAPERGEFIGLTAPYDSYSDEEKVDVDVDSNVSEYTKSWFVSAGDVNAERELSLPILTQSLIDLATNHANSIGIGNPYMPDSHTGWVLSRTCIEMNRFPSVDSDYSVTTWIENWNRHFSERCFSIADKEGNTVGYARQIWMVLDTVTHANAGLDRLPFKDEFISKRVCPIPRQGKHRQLILPSEVTGKESRVVIAEPDPAEYTFLYSDLDGYRHVNTVRYVRILVDQFSLQIHDEFMIRRIEVSFLDEGAYGMTVEILKAKADVNDEAHPDQIVYDLLLRDKASKTPVLFAKVFMTPRDKKE